jgi:hypothetical protein
MPRGIDLLALPRGRALEHQLPFAGMSRFIAAFASSRMPFKVHEVQGHHIPIALYRVWNWPDYDRGPVRRGDKRVWLSQDAIAGWRLPMGQRRAVSAGSPTYRSRPP